VDLCENPTLEGITASLQQGVVPRGIVDAGNYTYDRSANTVVKCVASCCLSATCEVHFSTTFYSLNAGLGQVTAPILSRNFTGIMVG